MNFINNNHAFGMDLEQMSNLPDQTYWGKEAEEEFFDSLGSFIGRLNFTRHLVVNGVPLYFSSVMVVEPYRWIRNPFETLKDGLLLLSHLQREGNTLGRVEFIPISELNELHRTYDEDGNEIVHDYTNWVARFGSRYGRCPSLVFDGLTKEHQERFLPDESRHLLLGDSFTEEKLIPITKIAENLVSMENSAPQGA